MRPVPPVPPDAPSPPATPSRSRAVPRAVAILAATLAVALGTLLGTAAPAAAHTALVGSDPSDGAALDVAPDRIVLRFSVDVALEALTVEHVEWDRATRTPIGGLTHGPGGRSEVVAPLPPAAGRVAVIWRLVSVDGHVVSGEVTFTTPTPSPSAPSPVATPPPTSAPVGADHPDDAGHPDDTGHLAGAAHAGPPAWLRWSWRAASYLALVALGGIVAVDLFVVPGFLDRGGVRRRVHALVAATAVLAALQLVVLASDLSARSPWAARGALDDALTTRVGVAFAVRLAVCGAVSALLAVARGRPVPRAAVASAALVLIATWSFAGHARSMRWPLLGVPLDIAHQAAAAAWIGGLPVVARTTLRPPGRPPGGPVAVVATMQRFSRLATVAVAVVAVTGAVQTLRLVGLPDQLLSSAYGRVLLAKVAVFAALLWVGARNRSRIARRFVGRDHLAPGMVRVLRRAMGTELVLGVAVLGLTAALVATMPPTAS